MRRTSSFFFYLEISDNQWQNIMRIWNCVIKKPLSPYTMLQTHNIAWRKFFLLFLNIFKRRKGEETRCFPSSNCPFIFVTDCWRNLKNLSAVFYSWSFWITLEVCKYPLCQYDISRNTFWSPKKQLKYRWRWDKMFVFQILFRKRQIITIIKKIPEDASLHVRLLHQGHKFPVCVIRRRYQESKNCANSTLL